MKDIIIHVSNSKEAINSAFEIVKKESYEKGLREALNKMEMIACVIPETITKKEIIRLLKREIEEFGVESYGKKQVFWVYLERMAVNKALLQAGLAYSREINHSKEPNDSCERKEHGKAEP